MRLSTLLPTLYTPFTYLKSIVTCGQIRYDVAHLYMGVRRSPEIENMVFARL